MIFDNCRAQCGQYARLINAVNDFWSIMTSCNKPTKLSLHVKCRASYINEQSVSAAINKNKISVPENFDLLTFFSFFCNSALHK